MTLGDLCNRLDEFDPEFTIYAREPWTLASEAVVAAEPDEGGLPQAAHRAGLAYFIEVFLAIEFLDGWESSLTAAPSGTARAQRLIDYAVNDA